MIDRFIVKMDFKKNSFKTPRTDGAERFMYVSGKPQAGFVNSEISRQIESELSMAMQVIEGKRDISELHALQNYHIKGNANKSQTVHHHPNEPHAYLSNKRQTSNVPVITKSPHVPVAKQQVERATPRKSNEQIGEKLILQTGDILFNKGDEADSLMIIQEGQVEIFDPTTTKTIAILDKGVCFGEQAILEGGLRTASARAFTPIVYLKIPTEPLRLILKTDPVILSPLMEALLLQLHMTNTISRLSDPMSDHVFYQIVEENKYSSTQLQKLLHEIFETGDKHGLSSQDMMFYRLQASSKFATSLHQAGDILVSEDMEHTSTALILIQGHVQATTKKKTYTLGPGSIMGLAEGLRNEPYIWTVKAKDTINILNLPIEKALRGLDHANAGIRGIVRYTTERIIQLQKEF